MVLLFELLNPKVTSMSHIPCFKIDNLNGNIKKCEYVNLLRIVSLAHKVSPCIYMRKRY